MNLVIPILEGNGLPTIATLGHVVREASDNHAGQAALVGRAFIL
jgi:hypothetical protein